MLKFVDNVLKQMGIKSLAMTIAKLDLIKKGIQLKLVLIKSNMLYQLKAKKIKVLVTFFLMAQRKRMILLTAYIMLTLALI
ncbi:hypothetical protein OQ620_28075 [Klebsiella pneumoniae]|nr:hypothetical protein [Klebsiella pneumoniae]